MILNLKAATGHGGSLLVSWLWRRRLEPDSPGVPSDLAKLTLTCPFNILPVWNPYSHNMESRSPP
jgi:glutamate-1-semialdehyde aminotransferase